MSLNLSAIKFKDFLVYMLLKSQRYTSKYLNKNKLQKLKKIDKHIKQLKNSISKFIYYHIDQLFYYRSIFNFSSKYSRKYKSYYLKSWNIQQLFQDICQLYLNMINANIKSINLNTTKSIKSIYYKKNIANHYKGDIKQFKLIKHNTNLSKLIKYLIYCDIKHLYITNPQILNLYNYYCQKFTKQRLLNLVKSIQQRILSKIHLITFNTGTFRAPYSTNKKTILSQFIKDDSNKLYKYWFKLDLRNQNIYLPLQYNNNYNNWNLINNSQFFIKLINNNKVNIISTKNIQQYSFKQFNKSIGIDINVKHNFCYCSNNTQYDYDRKYIKQFIKELKKLDKIGLKNISKSQQKHLNKLIKRNEWYFKYLIHNILYQLQKQNITDIVMEDLDTFKQTYIFNQQFNIKYSRLCRLLRLSNIKNWFKEQSQKRGIRLHLTPSNYTSQMCHKCGYIDKQNRIIQQKFKCINCGHQQNADINASINILNRLMNVSLKQSKLHKLDQYNRLVSNISNNKFIIKNILDSIFTFDG